MSSSLAGVPGRAPPPAGVLPAPGDLQRPSLATLFGRPAAEPAGASDAGASSARTIQRRLEPARSPGSEDPAAVQAEASKGVATPGGSLPHFERVQRAFGRHDVSGIVAHTGAEAAGSARAMGAEAYASEGHVVFAQPSPSLHTVAHEAAHVVQQASGVHLAGGVGREGDAYEQHADAVADRVVAGHSVEDLLSRFSGDVHAGRADRLQRKLSFDKSKKEWLVDGKRPAWRTGLKAHVLKELDAKALPSGVDRTHRISWSDIENMVGCLLNGDSDVVANIDSMTDAFFWKDKRDQDAYAEMVEQRTAIQAGGTEDQLRLYGNALLSCLHNSKKNVGGGDSSTNRGIGEQLDVGLAASPGGTTTVLSPRTDSLLSGGMYSAGLISSPQFDASGAIRSSQLTNSFGAAPYTQDQWDKDKKKY